MTKRVTFKGVRYEVEHTPKPLVKNTETGGYVRKAKDEIASMQDETIKMCVYVESNVATYEFWNKDEAIALLNRFKFDWLSADIYNSDGKLLESVTKQSQNS